ncbi:MAG: flavodoxin domain-containing protein [Chloroflexota bacterium]
MVNKILVTYATRAGSTQGIAEAIARTLQAQNFAVTLQAMQDVHDLSAYDAVIAGSAIRYDKWLPEATQFVERHQATLSQKAFAPFVVCLAMASQNPKRREKAIVTASNYLSPIRALVPTISEGLFAGVLDLSKLSLMPRIIFSTVTTLGLFKEGDYRDWDAIEQWTLDLSSRLVTQAQERYHKAS